MRYALYTYSGRTADQVLVIGRSETEIRDYIGQLEAHEITTVQAQLIGYPDESRLQMITRQHPSTQPLIDRGDTITVDWSVLDHRIHGLKSPLAPVYIRDHVASIHRIQIYELDPLQGYSRWIAVHDGTDESITITDVDGRFILGASYTHSKASWEAPVRPEVFRRHGYSAVSAKSARALAQEKGNCAIYPSLCSAFRAAARQMATQD